MKRLLKKKWVRVLVRLAVGGVTLLCLCWLAFNWWSAGRKSQAIAELRSLGVGVTLKELTANMPPAAQNYAETPLLGLLLREFELPEDQRSEAGAEACARFLQLSAPSITQLRRSNARRQEQLIDFSLLPDGSPFGRTAESFLSEYDRRNSQIIVDLAEGMDRAYNRRSLTTWDLDAPGVEWWGITERFGFSLLNVQTGLLTRADAALATGDSRKAAESVVLALKLSETAGSRGLMVGTFVEFGRLQEIATLIKRGAELHLWSASDLQRIGKALEQIELIEHLKRAIETESLWALVWDEWKDNRASFRAAGAEVFDLNSYPFDPSRWAYWLPGGWFDLHATGHLHANRDARELADLPGPMSHWWKECDRWMEEDQSSGALYGMLAPKSLRRPFAGLFMKGGFAIVLQRQALLACELESFRLNNGRFPENLDDFPTRFSVDPLHDLPFVYQLEGDNYLLYSVGPDGVDDGGSRKEVAGKPRDGQPDWVW